MNIYIYTVKLTLVAHEIHSNLQALLELPSGPTAMFSLSQPRTNIQMATRRSRQAMAQTKPSAPRRNPEPANPQAAAEMVVEPSTAHVNWQRFHIDLLSKKFTMCTTNHSLRS